MGSGRQELRPHAVCKYPARLQVLGLTTAVGVIRGTSSAEFAIALIFSMVVMYDASGVRLHAGKTASVLNMIITELPPDHPVSDTRPLRDTLGHTPLQARHPRPCLAAALNTRIPPPRLMTCRSASSGCGLPSFKIGFCTPVASRCLGAFLGVAEGGACLGLPLEPRLRGRGLLSTPECSSGSSGIAEFLPSGLIIFSAY